MKMVCHFGILASDLVNLIPINQRIKQILAIGAINSPNTAKKLAKKLGNGNHLKSIYIVVSTKKILQMIANLAIKAKKALLKKLLIKDNKLQDKKITQKGFLVVGL
jgi:hypothetical protein